MVVVEEFSLYLYCSYHLIRCAIGIACLEGSVWSLTAPEPETSPTNALKPFLRPHLSLFIKSPLYNLNVRLQ